MGLGDMFSGLFGGGNSYQYQNSPVMGLPRQPGESVQQYQARVQQNYNKINQGYQNTINQATQSAQALNKEQSGLAKTLGQRMGQNIDYSGANNSLGQQQAYLDMLGQQARGEGPNPALDQLNMTTNANIRNQAAALASARGMNPALAARQASQVGAQANQEAAGQAALQSAQQQLGAQQLAGNLLGQRAGLQSQMAGQNAQQQQNYAQLLAQALQGQRGQSIAQQAQTAGQQLGYQNLLQNAYNAMNNINSGVAAQNANTSGQYGQGIMSGLASGLGALAGFYEGGEVPYAHGGDVPKSGQAKVGYVMHEFGKGKLKSSSGAKVTNPKQAIAIAMSEAGLARKSKGGEIDTFAQEVAKKGMKLASGGLAQYQAFASGDPLGAELNNAQAPNTEQSSAKMSKLGEGLGNFLKNSFASSGAMGDFGVGSAAGMGELAALASQGGKIGGRAPVQGDSEQNDKVPALLSPGEIVIPRSATSDPDEAHQFVDKIMRKKAGSYADVVKAKRLFGGGVCQ